jgi:ATP/maltotriose-dependent transcriptional regulator MalT
LNRWQLIESLFEDAVERPPSERELFLRQACAHDAELFREVAALVAHDYISSDTMWPPAAAAQLIASASPPSASGLPNSLSPGTVLGPYTIVGVLGHGAMGEVYRARDSRLERDVAIKALPIAFGKDAQWLDRFKREARALASVNHASVEAIYDVLEWDGSSYLVLELVEGIDLAERLQHGPLSINDALSIGSQIAKALQAAHQKQIVHRDLKPANVRVTTDGLVKVLDFGIAKQASTHPAALSFQTWPVSETAVDRQTLMAGTPAYMSPEQACGRAVDHRADLWAFGCVLFELLTGNRAFDASTTSATLASIVRATPDLDRLPSDTPAALTQLIRQCLQRDVMARIQDADEVRRAIDNLVAARSAKAVEPLPLAPPAPSPFPKTSRPALSRTIDRPRLFRLLDRARTKPLTWVSGPPGSGKTTLVSSYLAEQRHRSIWYQLDDGDADTGTFFYYLGQAARKRRHLPLLLPEYRQGLPTFSRKYFRQLYSGMKPPFVMVFDNYHELPDECALHGVMREALAELPEGGRLIIISRGEPPAHWARARAYQMVKSVAWRDLRFTREEASRLARTLAPGRLTKGVVHSIHALADGWCAGLVLSFEQFTSGRRASSMPQLKSSELLFDYFATEIFKKTDRHTQEVLLETAFLPWVTTRLARELIGHATADAVLARFYYQNYFVNRRSSDGEEVFEYHPLFHEFLLAHAARTYTPHRRNKIRRRAAELTEAAGLVEASATLLREAEDWPGLAGLVLRHAPRYLGQGRGETIEKWLEALSPRMFERFPWLRYWRGICRFAWRHTDSQRDLGQAFDAFLTRGDKVGALLAWSALIIAYEGEGNAVSMDPWISRLEDVLRPNEAFPSKEVETRVAAGMLAAVCLRQPNHPDGAQWAERALQLSREHPDLAFRTITAFNWFCYYFQRGEHPRTIAIVDEMRALMRARNVSTVVAVNASLTVSWYEAFVAARSYRRTVAKVLELAHSSGMFYSARIAVLATGLFGALSDGDLKTAYIWCQELKKDLLTLGPGYLGWYYECLVRAALTRGDLHEAAEHQPEMLRLGLLGGWCLNCAAVLLLSVQVLNRCGDAQEARLHLKRAFETADMMRSPYVEFMARLVEAELCLDSGQEAEGLRALRQALALGKSRGFVNSRIWEPRSMARLSARALDAGIEVDYVRDLIHQRRLQRWLPNTTKLTRGSRKRRALASRRPRRR